MPLVSRRSIARARFEPEAVFAHPDELVAEVLLTCGQKIAALRRWRRVLEDRIQAAAEGMLPPNPEDALGDAATIAAIIRAEDKLRADTGNALSM
jgi:hypothetical protein